MTNVAEIARGLSKNARSTLASISPTFAVGNHFRLDEGEHHAPYTALVNAGLLSKQRWSGHYTTYSFTEEGLQVASHLRKEGGAS